MLMASCSSSKKAILSQTHTPQQSEIIIQENKGTKDNRMSKLMSEAKKWVGTKYRYGGQSREGTDCSGMVMALYNQVFGIKLPRSSREQHKYCKSIDRESLCKGDLLFFSSSKNSNTISHVGLYIGNNEMIHASTSRGVIVSNLSDKYYVRTYRSAGRVISTNDKSHHKTNKKKAGKIPADAPVIKLEDLIDSKIDSIYSSLPTS